MPNHVINEIIFRGVDISRQAEIIALACGASGKVDFEILVPAPLNMWWGSVGERHEKAFRQTHLDWARENWGTKWNAYDHHPIERADDTLILRFETAWRPPYGWLAAMFNQLKMDFEHNWFDEGTSRGWSAKFIYAHMETLTAEPWTEEPATDEMQRHLHKLLFGVEEFTDDDAVQS